MFYVIQSRMEKVLDIKQIETAAFILKSIGSPVRIGVIDLLRNYDELSVNELAEKLGIEQSLVSHHLSNMKLKGILGSRREGKHIFYFIKLKEVIKVMRCIENCQLEVL